MVAGAITNGEVKVRDCMVEHLGAVLTKLDEAGVDIKEEGDAVCISPSGGLRPFNIKTMPYPGFPTDMQAQFTALASIIPGTSIVVETIFENRFMHVQELVRMGADIHVKGNTAVIHGVETLSGAPVMATDLRASAALILAGLVAKGRTEVLRAYHLDRGYEDLEGKLSTLGARIWREEYG
jgi:UDP-N-acetylglucosamine 1-carboxyvinyltransferase